VDLQAATFDPRRLALTGGADSVLASIANTTSGIADFAIGGGTLAALAAPTERRATWADGVDAGAIARLSSIAISPDSRRAAGVLIEGTSSDIWIADLPAGALTRMTYGGVNVSPAWSPDGARLFFATRSSTGAFAIASRRIDERTITKVAAGDSHLFPSSIAPDGRIAVTTTSGAHTAVGIVPAGGGAVQLLQSAPFDEGAPVFSPDGHWLAIESSESGRREIVARDPGGEARVAISTDGGTRPRWSADGRTIYFEADGRAMRAAFDPDRGVARAPEAVAANGVGQVMAITPTGRVLTLRMAAPTRAFVVLQWLRELRERLPQPTTSPR
jgi:dipeptidyl aminopeptidase/acylaminoacyl peptidase